MSKVHVIASPRQSKVNGEIFTKTTTLPSQDGLIQKKSVQLFVHFAKLGEYGELMPYFLRNPEVMNTSNRLISEKLKLEENNAHPIYTTMSHISMALKNTEVFDIIKNYNINDDQEIRSYLKEKFPGSNIKNPKLKEVIKYLNEVQNGREPYKLYKIQSLIGRLALHITIEEDNPQECNCEGPVLIVGNYPIYWKSINFGKKKEENNKFGVSIETGILNIN